MTSKQEERQRRIASIKTSDAPLEQKEAALKKILGSENSSAIALRLYEESKPDTSDVESSY